MNMTLPSMVIRMIPSQHYDVYVASCTTTGGIYHYKMCAGHLKLAEITPMDRPMYMVIDNQKMYIVLRAPFDNAESGVVVYDMDDTGKLFNPSVILSTKGVVGCHIMVNEGNVYCANYLSGSLIRLPDKLVQHTGHGMNPSRQEGPHVHFVGITPDDKYICATDLGLDTIFLYDKELNLYASTKVPDGHGVRHLVFSEDGKYLFAVNELKSTVAAFAYQNGKLEFQDTCAVIPDSFTGETTAAAIRVRNGYIYVSNRGYDCISKLCFKDGKLALMNTFDCGGETPRDFDLAGNDLICANQDSDCVTILDMDDNFRIREQIAVEVPICICLCKGRE